MVDCWSRRSAGACGATRLAPKAVETDGAAPSSRASWPRCPILSDAERQQIVADLLDARRGRPSHRCRRAGRAAGFEERGYEHEESGCYVFLRGWRERADAPLCILEALHWVPPREEPILDYLTAKSELERALREGRVHAIGEGLPGQPIELPPKTWLFTEIGLTSYSRQIDAYSLQNYDAGGQSRISRLRFPVDENKGFMARQKL